MTIAEKSVLSKMQMANEVFTAGNALLKDFDLLDSSEDVSSQEIPIHCDLAFSLGELTSDAFKDMDEHLQVMIGATLKTLEKLEDKSWGNLVSTFSQNAFMERVDNSEIARHPTYHYDPATGVFKTDGSPNDKIVKEVKSWYVDDLINDEDVYRSSKINIDELANIVASTGARVSSFAALFGKTSRKEKSVVDIGVIRFPDIDNPFVKLYRIKVVAWAKCERILMVQTDHNGIVGEYNSMKFKPRESVMKELSQDVKNKAIAEAESMFA